MENPKKIIDLILKGIALAMSIASIIMGIFGEATFDTHVTLLGIGLLALAIAGLQKVELD
jgi:hypothetical protein